MRKKQSVTDEPKDQVIDGLTNIAGYSRVHATKKGLSIVSVRFCKFYADTVHTIKTATSKMRDGLLDGMPGRRQTKSPNLMKNCSSHQPALQTYALYEDPLYSIRLKTRFARIHFFYWNIFLSISHGQNTNNMDEKQSCCEIFQKRLNFL